MPSLLHCLTHCLETASLSRWEAPNSGKAGGPVNVQPCLAFYVNDATFNEVLMFVWQVILLNRLSVHDNMVSCSSQGAVDFIDVGKKDTFMKHHI